MSPSTFREFLHSLFEKYTEVPITNLEVKKGKLKRASGLFQTWANCYVVITRDSYCHIFDSEADIQPLFTFDLLKTQVYIFIVYSMIRPKEFPARRIPNKSLNYWRISQKESLNLVLGKSRLYSLYIYIYIYIGFDYKQRIIKI